jgi:hypothetical protein
MATPLRIRQFHCFAVKFEIEEVLIQDRGEAYRMASSRRGCHSI